MEKETAAEVRKWKEMTDVLCDVLVRRISLVLLRAQAMVYEGWEEWEITWTILVEFSGLPGYTSRTNTCTCLVTFDTLRMLSMRSETDIP